MNSVRLIAFTIATTMTASIAGQSQSTADAQAIGNKAPADKKPVENVSHKIGADYYPMLDRPSLTSSQMTAENGDMPLTENERIAREQRNRGNKNVAAPIAPEDRRSRGRLRSYTRVIDDAQQVQVVIKNTESKLIKSID